MARENAARRAHLYEAILRHIRAHPLAGDTPEGILANWLPKSKPADASDYIDAVLNDLVANHFLRPMPLPDGKVLYLRGDALDL